MATFTRSSNFNAQFGTYALREIIDTDLAVDVELNRSQYRRRLQIVRVSHSGNGIFNLNASQSSYSMAAVGDGNANGTFTYDFRGTSDGHAITILNQTRWVDHNPDGKKSLIISSSVTAVAPLNNASLGALTRVLPNIPRGIHHKNTNGEYGGVILFEKQANDEYQQLILFEKQANDEYQQLA